jgi:hypothetical protein
MFQRISGIYVGGEAEKTPLDTARVIDHGVIFVGRNDILKNES